MGLRATTYDEQLAYAARRLAITSPDRAYTEWTRLRRDRKFADELDVAVARQVALWATRRNLDNADALIGRLMPAAVNDEVLRWRARGALRRGDWVTVRDAIDALSPNERARAEWRYWKALALLRTNADADAMLLLSGLARERSYYGFLAADFLGTEYALDPAPVAAIDAVLDELESDPGLIRARELFLTGLDGRARSEWQESSGSSTETDARRRRFLPTAGAGIRVPSRWPHPSVSTTISISDIRCLTGMIFVMPRRPPASTKAGRTALPETRAVSCAIFDRARAPSA